MHGHATAILFPKLNLTLNQFTNKGVFESKYAVNEKIGV